MPNVPGRCLYCLYIADVTNDRNDSSRGSLLLAGEYGLGQGLGALRFGAFRTVEPSSPARDAGPRGGARGRGRGDPRAPGARGAGPASPAGPGDPVVGAPQRGRRPGLPPAAENLWRMGDLCVFFIFCDLFLNV